MAMEKEWLAESFRQREITRSHRALESEFAFYDAVRNGDLEFVRRNCESNDFAKAAGMGILSESDLQNMRYHFIITAALVSRFCVEGGMVLEQAYGLSDFYITRMDRLMNSEDIVQLHHVMVLDFTERMNGLRQLPEITKPVKCAVDYIYLHLHEKIALNELAESAGVSPGYLSKLFRKELGINVSDYITELKIDEAKNLLKYSDMPIVEIANYLAFASQSYFVHVFHKRMGTTPRKYRESFYQRERSLVWTRDKLIP
ncbi:MAG: helix-turn-helix domain-containing protein [Ruminococcaceae bacterium]|nr:helix-turn-helix domain-containing protein [Oscillospiraceae bacterium]